VGSNLGQNTRWKWSTFKAMTGSIPAPNSGSFVEKTKKNICSQMGQTDKKNFNDLHERKTKQKII
jgi:hypothetical protein